MRKMFSVYCFHQIGQLDEHSRTWKSITEKKYFSFFFFTSILISSELTHIQMFPCVFQARIALTCVGWRKNVVLFNPKFALACLLKSLIMWMNLTPRSWTFTLTQGVTPVILKDCRLSLITRQPLVIHRVSTSRSLGSTVTWARAITTSPTDVTWDRLRSPNLLSNKARLSRRSAAQEFPRSHENGKS